MERKTKIICTIGPVSESQEMMEKLVQTGMNMIRLNFSHGDYEEHGNRIRNIRAVDKKVGCNTAILLDTKGPEVRLGDFENKEEHYEKGDIVTIVREKIMGTHERFHIQCPEIFDDVEADGTILIDDGKVRLTILEKREGELVCRIENPGVLKSRKGCNLPGVKLSMPFVSEKDEADIRFGCQQNVDYIAASFVRSAGDVRAVRSLLDENGGKEIKLIAKIESTQGIENFEEILQLADGIMVARGDMGVEVAYEKLPGIQKRFIRRCVQSGKIVITATQMLESMITSPIPTRAEITDVANAVFDGTTAVMLSGETAAGRYPVEAVATMAKIAQQAEADQPTVPGRDTVWHEMDAEDVTNAVGHAACTLAKDIKAGAIMAITKTGYTAKRMSKFRPTIRIIGATPYEKTFHQLALVWGVCPIMANYRYEIEELFSHCVRKAVSAELLKQGDKIVITAGLPVDVPGNTNIIRVVEA